MLLPGSQFLIYPLLWVHARSGRRDG